MNTDKRVVKTRALIRAAYLDSVRELGIRKTTIKNICEKAFISRRTFYLHYETVDFLFNEIMDECWQFEKFNVAKHIQELQLDYYRTDFNRYHREVVKLISKEHHELREKGDLLRIFFSKRNPEFELYFIRRNNRFIPLCGAEENFQTILSHNMICAERNEILKYDLFHPEISVEDIAEFTFRQLHSDYHLVFNNSDTFSNGFHIGKLAAF